MLGEQVPVWCHRWRRRSDAAVRDARRGLHVLVTAGEIDERSDPEWQIPSFPVILEDNVI